MRTIVLLAVLVTAFAVPGCVNQAQGEKQSKDEKRKGDEGSTGKLWLLLSQEGDPVDKSIADKLGYKSTASWYKTKEDCEKGGRYLKGFGHPNKTLCVQSIPHN